jgi:hypothetical protein
MDEYSTTYRPVSPWGTLFLAVPIGLFLRQVSLARPDDHLVGLPLVAVFAYGMAVSIVNRTSVRVTPEGAGISYGPMPCAGWRGWMPRTEISKVYLRQVVLKYETYLAAGVVQTDGQLMDLTEPRLSEEDIRRKAQELAAILRCTLPIQELRHGEGSYAEPRRPDPLGLWFMSMFAGVLWEYFKFVGR